VGNECQLIEHLLRRQPQLSNTVSSHVLSALTTSPESAWPLPEHFQGRQNTRRWLCIPSIDDVPDLSPVFASR
jgi:hypothetical protein